MDFGKIEIKESNVGAEFAHLAKRGGAIRTGGHHLEVSAVHAESSESLAHERKGFRDEQSNLLTVIHDPSTPFQRRPLPSANNKGVDESGKSSQEKLRTALASSSWISKTV